jgi:hypothetical protein
MATDIYALLGCGSFTGCSGLVLERQQLIDCGVRVTSQNNESIGNFLRCLGEPIDSPFCVNNNNFFLTICSLKGVVGVVPLSFKSAVWETNFRIWLSQTTRTRSTWIHPRADSKTSRGGRQKFVERSLACRRNLWTLRCPMAKTSSTVLHPSGSNLTRLF